MIQKQNYFTRVFIGVLFLLMVVVKTIGLALWSVFYLLMAICEFLLIALGWYNDLSGMSAAKPKEWAVAIMDPSRFLAEYFQINGKRFPPDQHPN